MRSAAGAMRKRGRALAHAQRCRKSPRSRVAATRVTKCIGGHSMGLIHMNGRVFDSKIGRFLSADPLVQAPQFSQSFNRYSYLFNNPFSGTDPTGFMGPGTPDEPGGNFGDDPLVMWMLFANAQFDLVMPTDREGLGGICPGPPRGNGCGHLDIDVDLKPIDIGPIDVDLPPQRPPPPSGEALRMVMDRVPSTNVGEPPLNRTTSLELRQVPSPRRERSHEQRMKPSRLC